MRSKLSIFLKMAPIMCALFFSTSKTFSGQEGHGGQTVDIDGQPVLRDFVDSTNCEWIRAEDFVVNVNLTVLPDILSSIEKVHWYFADAISREIHEGELAVCQTWAELKKIPEDSDDVTIVELDTKQAAVRINDMIFIDMPLFEKLDVDSKAYLFLHEIMHSFVPLHTPRRNGKLRSMISIIRKHQAVPMSKEHFGLQIKMNSIDMPTTDNPLELYYKENLLFILDDTKKAVERAPFAFQLPNGFIESLSNKDKKKVHSLQALAPKQYGEIIIAWKNAYAPGDEFLLYMAVRQGDLKRVQQLAQNPKLKFNLAIYDDSLLRTAVKYNYIDITQWLIENKVSELSDKEFVLWKAYNENNYDLFKLLAPHVESSSAYCNLMFFYAVDDKRLEYLKLTLKWKNFPINSQRLRYYPYDTYTALHIAAEKGNVEMVKELIKYPGIDPFIEVEKRWGPFTVGMTPRDLAEEKGHEEIEKILEEFEDSLDE